MATVDFGVVSRWMVGRGKEGAVDATEVTAPMSSLFDVMFERELGQ